MGDYPFNLDIDCDVCSFHITREILAVAEFARYLALDLSDPSDFFLFKCAVYLPKVIPSFRPILWRLTSLGDTLLDYSGRPPASSAIGSRDRFSRIEDLQKWSHQAEFTVRDHRERDIKHGPKFSIVELSKNLDPQCLMPSG